jgi:adenosine deaminase
VAFKNRGVVAFDLAGAEYNYPAKDHKQAFQLILDNNVNCTAHAGEAYGPESIAQAIHYCGAHRIGHGTRLRENGDLLNYCNDHRIPLEICLSSNVQTRAAPDIASHPLPFFYTYGLRVTINTDNRLMTDTTVSKELLLIHQSYGFQLDDIKELIISGFKSAFLPYREKADVLKKVTQELAGFVEPADTGKRPAPPVVTAAAKPLS